MSPVVAAAGAALLVVATIVVLTVWGRVRYARRLPWFRCRVGPSVTRRRRARWRRRRTSATWVEDVLLIRSGALRLWITPVSVGIAREVTVHALAPGDVRGLGRHPVALRFALRPAGELEIAVASEDADRLVGPFLAAALPELPGTRRERDV